jgi:phage baseplate assembly protein W
MYKDLITIELVNTEIKAINNSIRNILLTRRGSVPGKPRFGSDLYTLIFNQLDSLTESVAKSMIFACLTEFENRINIIDIDLKSVEEYNKLVITINYRYKDNFGQTTNGLASISMVN